MKVVVKDPPPPWQRSCQEPIKLHFVVMFHSRLVNSLVFLALKIKSDLESMSVFARSWVLLQKLLLCHVFHAWSLNIDYFQWTAHKPSTSKWTFSNFLLLFFYFFKRLMPKKSGVYKKQAKWYNRMQFSFDILKLHYNKYFVLFNIRHIFCSLYKARLVWFRCS